VLLIFKSPCLTADYLGGCILQGAIKITKDNEHLLRTRYESRSEKELPVLVRYFPKGSVSSPPASYFDLILYSREQINKESVAMGKDKPKSVRSFRKLA